MQAEMKSKIANPDMKLKEKRKLIRYAFLRRVANSRHADFE
jgi:hypothetical protein